MNPARKAFIIYYIIQDLFFKLISILLFKCRFFNYKMNFIGGYINFKISI